MIIKLKDNLPLNQEHILFQKLFILADFSHIILSILLLDLIKTVKELFMDMMLSEVMEVTKH